MKTLLTQIARFATVGVAATLTHVGVLGLAHWALGAGPQLANVFGFLVASSVTYWGNQRWTFEGRASHSDAASRFVLLAAASLGASSAATWIATDVMGWGVAGAMALVVTTVPALSFVLSRVWVFRPTEPGEGTVEPIAVDRPDDGN